MRKFLNCAVIGNPLNREPKGTFTFTESENFDWISRVGRKSLKFVNTLPNSQLQYRMLCGAGSSLPSITYFNGYRQSWPVISVGEELMMWYDAKPNQVVLTQERTDNNGTNGRTNYIRLNKQS